MAEQLASDSNMSVSLIATALANDAQMQERIARHQTHREKNARSANWTIIEEPYALADAVNNADTVDQCIIIDCLTLWLTQLLVADNATRLQQELNAFTKSIDHVSGQIIIVSNENNMGIIPLGELSRRYCDEIGLLHQRVASQCERVILSLAGLPMMLKGDKPKSFETMT